MKSVAVTRAISAAICVLVTSVSLAQGFDGTQAAPAHWFGVVLVFLGVILIFVEALAPTFGVVGAAGVVAIIVGAVFMKNSGLFVNHSTTALLAGMVIAAVVLLGVAGVLAVRAHKRRVVTGADEMVGLAGVVTFVRDAAVYAHVRGESWEVKCEQALSAGDRVRVVALEGLVLRVQRDTGGPEPSSVRSEGENRVL